MRRWSPLLLALGLLVAGCGKPVLDSKNLDRSIAKLRGSVDETQQGAFDAAIALVRQASAGKIAGTDSFPLDGMTADQVLAEAERIDLRRERAGELESIAAQRDLLATDEKLARLAVVTFVSEPVGDTRMDADVTVHNGLDFPVDTAWLRIEVSIPGGASRAGEEFLAFEPALAPGEQRTMHMEVIGEEARSLPIVPPAVLATRFVMAEHGGQLSLKSPTPEERSRAQADLDKSRMRVSELDARLAATEQPKKP
jgi:hypothetical protein